MPILHLSERIILNQILSRSNFKAILARSSVTSDAKLISIYKYSFEPIHAQTK